jgi:hypothetical protein
MAGIGFKSFAGQNWVITPAALAVNEPKPTSISDQNWLVVLTGVGVLDLQGNNVNHCRREVLVFFPDINAPLQFAVNKYSIPKPAAPNVAPALDLELWAPFAAVSSTLSKETGVVDAGFSVDAWRPNPFLATTDAFDKPVSQVFTGIDVDVAVRNTGATLHRVSYHITLVGKIVFLLQTV